MEIIRDTLATLELGTPGLFENLTLFPLMGGPEGAKMPDYLTLEEALAQKTARVTEVSESGSVPELRFVNEGDKRVLLLDGEEVVGAKQNRILNLTILVDAKQTLLIPVSCVEAGRWNAQSVEFAAAPRAHYAAGRASKMEQVTRNLSSHHSHGSDQSAVWADISAKSARMRVNSPTSAAAEMYEQNAPDIEGFVRALPSVPGQVGALFAINGKIVGMDVFDSAATLHKLLPKLIRSTALDAIDARPAAPCPPITPEAAQAFVRAVADARTEVFAALGVGEDIRLSAPALTGGALLAEGRLIHLSAFQLETASSTAAGEDGHGYHAMPTTTLSRASQRRNLHR